MEQMYDDNYDDYEYENDDGEVEYADYYEDDTYDPSDGWEDIGTPDEEEQQRLMSLNELYKYCVVPTFTDSYKHILTLISFSFIFLISCRSIRLPALMIHALSLLSGGALVFQMFQWRCKYMVALVVAASMPLAAAHHFFKSYRGPTAFVSGVLFLLLCESHFVDPLWWHAIRGVQMVLLMKVVSVGYDLDSKRLDSIPNPVEMMGYLANPGSILFGPWTSFADYQTVVYPFRMSFRWFGKIVLKLVLSGAFLILSTCFVNWFIPDNSSKWLIAFRDAISFRCSHYFVSYLSEVSSSLAGIDVGSVSEPWAIEAPRSLVQVVIYWNKPMHHWLKNYVFKPTRNQIGIFWAILGTYATSAMFHGLNFQLASVLISLGFYTFTEHNLRTKLSSAFNACVLARPCKEGCQHAHKGSSFVSLLVNSFFMIVSMFHLAYLGMMFDSSRGSQEQGYSMAHTMRKWGMLNYSSHWLAFAMFVVMSII